MAAVAKAMVLEDLDPQCSGLSLIDVPRLFFLLFCVCQKCFSQGSHTSMIDIAHDQWCCYWRWRRRRLDISVHKAFVTASSP